MKLKHINRETITSQHKLAHKSEIENNLEPVTCQTDTEVVNHHKRRGHFKICDCESDTMSSGEKKKKSKMRFSTFLRFYFFHLQ